mgnify:CR=1 FL=1
MSDSKFDKSIVILDSALSQNQIIVTKDAAEIAKEKALSSKQSNAITNQVPEFNTQEEKNAWLQKSQNAPRTTFILPEKSIASFPVSLNVALDILPLQKSASNPSNAVLPI